MQFKVIEKESLVCHLVRYSSLQSPVPRDGTFHRLVGGDSLGRVIEKGRVDEVGIEATVD